jgi:hypothetical protein
MEKATVLFTSAKKSKLSLDDFLIPALMRPEMPRMRDERY